jgi:hypothetical protein
MRLVWLGFVVSLVACGDDGVTIDSSSSNFCDQIAEVACHNLYQCCTEGEIENYLNVSDPRTEVQCRDDVTRSCHRQAAEVEDSIKQNRITFDAKKFNDCLTAIVAPDGVCSDIVMELPWKTACMNTAFVGAVATGASCLFDFDCQGAPDSFCAPAQKCMARPTSGQPCGTGCASAFYCNGGTCAAKVAAGGVCTSSLQCEKDLFCDFTAMPQPVCAALLPGGSPCTSSSLCESNSCVPGQCSGTGVSCYNDAQCSMHCANSTAFCTTASNCALGTCSVGLNSCSSNTQCVGGVGDVCNFPVQCVPGDCIGDPVCRATELTVDYCTGALSVQLLP